MLSLNYLPISRMDSWVWWMENFFREETAWPHLMKPPVQWHFARDWCAQCGPSLVFGFWIGVSAFWMCRTSFFRIRAFRWQGKQAVLLFECLCVLLHCCLWLHELCLVCVTWCLRRGKSNIVKYVCFSFLCRVWMCDSPCLIVSGLEMWDPK